MGRSVPAVLQLGQCEITHLVRWLDHCLVYLPNLRSTKGSDQ